MIKKVGVRHASSMMLFYEMIGGFLGLTCLLPFYLHFFPVETILPGMTNFLYLLLLSLVCTIGLYLLQIQVLKQVSAFTVNLSYNLEPVYSIILAMLFSARRRVESRFLCRIGIDSPFCPATDAGSYPL